MEVDTKPIDLKVEPSTSSATTSSKLGLCEVCAIHDGKYTCPRCEVKTCSLKCNKIHKVEVECDGQRDRTKFIPLNRFTNLDLSSDYRLLEEITRNLEASKKNFGKRWTHLPVPLMKLRTAAKLRRTTLKFLPHVFTKRKNNSTYFLYKTNTIYWHIDWIFDNADNLRLTDTKVSELTTLGSVLSKYFVKQTDEHLQEKLQYYQAADFSRVRLLLEAEQKRGKKFYDLDVNSTVRECLENKLVIEYPTIHVILADHAFGYNIIDSDNEDGELEADQRRTGNDVVANIVHKAKDKGSFYGCLKNLLFLSDEEFSSDGE